MDLSDRDENRNLLPYDGEVIYIGKILSRKSANDFFNILLSSIPWKRDEVKIFGKHIITKRKVAWYADGGLSYAYSNTTKEGLQWTAELLQLKGQVEGLSDTKFNSCLLNLYHNGSEGMNWHSDDEKSLVANSTIASLSFGAERKFALKHKQTKETITLNLENGSLLLMKGLTQSYWLHSLPKSAKVSESRVNLTFRCMKV